MGKSKVDATLREKDKKVRKSTTKDKKRDSKNEKGRKGKKKESSSVSRHSSSSVSAEVDDDWKQQTVMIARSFGLTPS